jgi:hypothetical protein
MMRRLCVALISLYAAIILVQDSFAFQIPLAACHHCRIRRTNQPLIVQSGMVYRHPESDRTRLYKGMWSQDEELEGSDRFKACVPYILPLLDGDQFGHYIYERVPPIGFLNDLFLSPLVNIYHHIPFLGVGIFILLTLGTRFNTDMNRNVRFSAQQAALIDVALILPELVASGFDGVDVPRALAEPCSNFVWYAYMTAVGYSIYCNLSGKKPDQIPYISGSADMMVGPF